MCDPLPDEVGLELVQARAEGVQLWCAADVVDFDVVGYERSTSAESSALTLGPSKG